jgi:CubicO group peptidase (beta-lactamase class C family)
MFVVAGEVIAAASGMAWEDFVQTRILDRLGMTETLPVMIGADPAKSALPHGRVGPPLRYQGEMQTIGQAYPGGNLPGPRTTTPTRHPGQHATGPLARSFRRLVATHAVVGHNLEVRGRSKGSRWVVQLAPHSFPLPPLWPPALDWPSGRLAPLRVTGWFG